MSNNNKVVLQAEVSGKCPFCNLEISFGSVPKPFAAHALPMCKQYEQLDALEFIRAVNQRLASPRTS